MSAHMLGSPALIICICIPPIMTSMPSHRYRKSRLSSELNVVRQPGGGALRSVRGGAAVDGAVAVGLADADSAADCAARTTDWRLAGISGASDMTASLYPY